MIATTAILALLGLSSLSSFTKAEQYRRLGACPTLGCVFPPDQAEFLAGARFDIRLEIHAPINGSEAFADGKPDENFTFKIKNDKGYEADVTDFFEIKPAPLEKWNFTYYEDQFAVDAKTPVVVNVAAKAYRTLSLYEPGEYTATLSYYNGQQTVAHWSVRAPCDKPIAKNVIVFIGDGMPQSAISAARLISKKQINGKYQSMLAIDSLQNQGLQMTHSLDSFITDSANSATALYTGHKSTVNALGVYVDSSKNPFDDPKVETVFELFRRQRKGGATGLVSTAFLADATPMAAVGHTRDRGQYAPLVAQYLYGTAQNYSSWNPEWAAAGGPDVLMGGGAEQFIPGPGSPNGTNFYDAFAQNGHQVVYDKTHLLQADNTKPLLGVFSKSNMAKWVDRNVYTDNLRNQSNNPYPGAKGDALDQPGLAEMTIKAIDVLSTRSKANGDAGFLLMSEAASIDKMFHVLDYERALGELLELDDTLRQTLEHLEKIGELEETMILLTADHAHGFDVFGSSDVKYLKAQTSDRKKRSAIGVYTNSGLSEYVVAAGSKADNHTILPGDDAYHFPQQWDPRYALAAGFAANPDHRETYGITLNGPRVPATNSTPAGDDYTVNPKDNVNGFVVNGTLPGNEPQGVHSLSDVSVFCSGPGSELCRGVYENTEIFFHITKALGLGTTQRP